VYHTYGGVIEISYNDIRHLFQHMNYAIVLSF
jgi:hypothetical protein